MAVHFIHVSKTGGTAIRHAVRKGRRNAGGELETPWGPIVLHRHAFTLKDVPRGDRAFFALRDPVARYLSGYYSRLRKGAPRYVREWTDGERRAFERFPTPQALADALTEPRGKERRHAELAMDSIRQLQRHLTLWTGKPSWFRSHLDKVLFIARQETLDDDWESLKELLELPPGLSLPRGDVKAHRTAYPDDLTLGDAGVAAIRDWYAADYEVLAIAEEVRGRQRTARGSVAAPG